MLFGGQKIIPKASRKENIKPEYDLSKESILPNALWFFSLYHIGGSLGEPNTDFKATVALSTC